MCVLRNLALYEEDKAKNLADNPSNKFYFGNVSLYFVKQ